MNDNRAEALYQGECYECADDEVTVALPFNNTLPTVTRLSARLPIHSLTFEQPCARCESRMMFTFLRYRTPGEPEGVAGVSRAPILEAFGVRIIIQ